jgi:hypothetical protein
MYYAAQEHGSHKYDKKETGQHHFGVQYRANHLHGGVLMSDYVEIIHPQEMKARLMCNGEIVEEYKIEQCDKCSQLRRLDHFGYQKGYDKQDNIIWFCGDCR